MPGPVSPTSELDVGAGGQLGGLARSELDAPGGEPQAAAGEHGVAGVDRQVEQHLLELPEVDVDGAVLRIELDLEADVLADQPAQHRRHLADHPVEGHHPRLQHLLAAVGEELAGQRGRALAGALDLLDVGAPLVLRRHAVAEQLALEGDGRQQVVERMGDAAGQPAHRLQALGVAQPLLARPQRLLGRLGGGDVAQGPAQPRRPVERVEIADAGQHHHERFAVARPDSDLQLAGRLTGANAREEIAKGLAIRHLEIDGERLAGQQVLADAEHLGGHAVGLLHDAVSVGDQVAERRLLEEMAVAVALALQRLAGGVELLVLLLELLVGHLEAVELLPQILDRLSEFFRTGELGGLALQRPKLALRRGELEDGGSLRHETQLLLQCFNPAPALLGEAFPP